MTNDNPGSKKQTITNGSVTISRFDSSLGLLSTKFINLIKVSMCTVQYQSCTFDAALTTCTTRSVQINTSAGILILASNLWNA